MIVSSWFDRPLSVAGRVLFEQKGKIEEKPWVNGRFSNYMSAYREELGIVYPPVER